MSKPGRPVVPVRHRIVSAIALFFLILPGITLAQASECEFRPEATNPDTNEPIIRTKWTPIKQGDGSGMSFTRGRVQGISDGNAKYLGVKIGHANYYAIPEELGISLEDTNIITKKGAFDPRLNPWVEELANTPVTFPTGSTLRFTLEDRTTLTIRSDEDLSFLGEVTKPAWNDNLTDKFRVAYTLTPRFALDAEAIALLGANLVVALRLELPNHFYYFGHRNLIWDDKVIAKKSMATIQGILTCVL
jgi:hypothetical protein